MQAILRDLAIRSINALLNWVRTTAAENAAVFAVTMSVVNSADDNGSSSIVFNPALGDIQMHAIIGTVGRILEAVGSVMRVDAELLTASHSQ